MSVAVTVEADVGATQAELAAIADAFRRAGFDVHPKAVVSGRIGGPLPWVLYVTLGAPIATFFTTLAARAAEDTYDSVSAWVKDLWAARRGAGSGTGSVVLRDVDNSTLVLSAALPDDALHALRTIDWALQKGEYLVWNEMRSEWLDPMKHPSDF